MSILFVFLLAVVPACGEESELYVAKIGDEGYTTLQAAIEAVGEGDTIILLTDTMIGDGIGQIFVDTSKDVKIVGMEKEDGTTTSVTGQFKVSGVLKLQNVTIKTPISSIPDEISQFSKSAIAVTSEGQVVCENVTFEMKDGVSDATAISGWWDVGVGTNIIVKNCTFNCNGQRPLRSCGSMTVENCTFNDPYRYAVQLTAKTSTATDLENAVVTFTNNTIINGANGKTFVYGIQLEGGTYGCNDLIVNGNGNTISAGEWDTNNESVMYYCECGKVNHATVGWNVEVPAVHEDVSFAPVAKIGIIEFGTLADAIKAAVDGDTITFTKNITEDVTVTQKEGVNVTIDGDGKTFTGVMTVWGEKRYKAADTLTVRDMVFRAVGGKSSCIVSPRNGDGGVTYPQDVSYAHNVFIENCTFIGDSSAPSTTVGIRSCTGGDSNWVITNCTADENMHSLLWAGGVEALTISDCSFNGTVEGVNLGNSTDVNITDCDFNAKAFAVRMGGTNGEPDLNKSANTFTFKNNTLKSDCDNNGAVLVVRTPVKNAVINMTKNAFSGTTHISGVTEATNVSADENYWDGKSKPVVSGELAKDKEVKTYYKDEGCTQLALSSDAESIFQPEDGAADIEIDDGLPDDVEPIYVPSAETLANDSSERPYAEGYVFTGWKDNQNGTVTAEWVKLPNFTFDDLVKAHGYLNVAASDAEKWSSASVYNVDASDAIITMSDIILLSQYIADATSQQAKSD